MCARHFEFLISASTLPFLGSVQCFAKKKKKRKKKKLCETFTESSCPSQLAVYSFQIRSLWAKRLENPDATRRATPTATLISLNSAKDTVPVCGIFSYFMTHT